MYAKISVTGPRTHPLYRALTEAQPTAEFNADSALREYWTRVSHESQRLNQGEIHWNLERFVIDRSGTVVRRFAPDIEPWDLAPVQAIETALAT